MKNVINLKMIALLCSAFIAYQCQDNIDTESDTMQTKKVVPDILNRAEVMPLFPGCDDVIDATNKTDCSKNKLLKFIYTNVKYPASARKNNEQGTVITQFVIGKDGVIQDETILRDASSSSLAEESLRVIRSMPPWIPGRQDGKAVAVRYNLPIKFKLE